MTQTTEQPDGRTYTRPESLCPVHTSYCPGCGHGIALRLIAELIDEMGLRDRTIGIAPVGCAVTMYDFLDVDMSEAAHGRPPAVATGIKRARPDRLVFTYQGDGDLAAIGAAETLHCANRGERITTIFINNTVYGMTGGQMAPTTLAGQVTTTTPSGRDPQDAGPPLRVCELLATLDNAVYIERCSVHSPGHVRKTKKAIRHAFETQLEGRGYSLVEVLSPCAVYAGRVPLTSIKRVGEELTTIFPLGVFKDWAEKP